MGKVKDIKMVDLQGQYLRIKDEIDAAMQKILMSTAFIQGPQVKSFTDAIANYNHSPYAITCANGTDALQIAMMALDLKAGDEVILPVHTYVATAEVIALLGLTPVFIDVDDKTFNIDPSQIKSKITPRTKAIVPVHLYGQCADMEPILKVARESNLHVIEDLAQALGSDYTFSDGTVKRAGNMGIIGCTSFFPSKNLGCFGDGGAIFTADQALAEKMKMISTHGQKVKYQHDIVGVNSRLDTLQAAILEVKLKYLDSYTRARNEAADYYDQHLAGVSFIDLPVRARNSTHVFHQYTLKINGVDRDRFKKYLEDKGIPSMIYYHIPLHLQKAYVRDGFSEGSFPVTEKLSQIVLSLPIHTEMTESELSYICETIRQYNG